MWYYTYILILLIYLLTYSAYSETAGNGYFPYGVFPTIHYFLGHFLCRI